MNARNFLYHTFQDCKQFRNRFDLYREIATWTWPNNEHVCAICCWPEIPDDVISGEGVHSPFSESMCNDVEWATYKKWSTWITQSKTVIRFEINPKLTCLFDLLSNWSRVWRHFRKDIEVYIMINSEVASSNSFRGGGRRTSTIALCVVSYPVEM